ncbi:MAG: hypothetical protein HY726_22180 [Candidatus Rokubacteria bacterium]|nr:hypothetical protein [Candidatus Rokubacteria bacterium]
MLKILLPEPESGAVQAAVAGEELVVLSTLAELEAEVQLRAAWLGGAVTRTQYRRLTARLRNLGQREPFEVRQLPGRVFSTALRQHRERERPHARTLDRLHLAAMEELGVHRLMTHDVAQAGAARAARYAVVTPGR